MKITILTPDLSSNSLGRAYLLAKILQRHYKVEIIGPIFGEGIWKPVAYDKTIKYKSIKISGNFRPYWQIIKLIKQIDGDIIYASKPLFSSFGIGLIKKLSSKKPLMLDIDDWEMGAIRENYRGLSFAQYLKYIVKSTLYFYGLTSIWNNLINEKLVSLADVITVSNHFLGKIFGGEIIWHARDTDHFNPNKYDKNLLIEKYKVDGSRKIILFLGTPRIHKGLEYLINAVKILQNDESILYIVGLEENDGYSKKIENIAKEMLGNRFRGFGLQPFELIPEYLYLADIVVIPQSKNSASVGQIPAKVFDAMAMAKPIIATKVSDLPEILNGCGWIVEPDKPEELANTIRYIFDNPEEAERMGLKARQKCIEKYSFNTIEENLLKILKNMNKKLKNLH